jgi:endoglucanase
MNQGFLRVKGQDFDLDGEKIILRGYGLGSLLNLEHFMLGMPGTDAQIRSAIIQAYGEENAKRFWTAYYRAMIDEADFEFLKQLGVNSLRVSFNFRLFEDDQNPYEYHQDGFAEIDRILMLCEKYGIFAILDLHAAPGGQNPDWHSDNALGESLLWEEADFRKRTIALWKHIATHYASNQWIGAYDLLNEPVLMIADKRMLNQFYLDLIREIRSVDPNHMLFVEGDFYATRFDMLDPFDDSNVALSFHFYPFFHQDHSTKTTQKERLKEEMLLNIPLDEITKRFERPLWCGETGARFGHPRREHFESMLEDVLDIFEERGISWSIWAYKDARTMGTVHPKAESDWMDFARQVSKGWSFWREFPARFERAEEALSGYDYDVPDIVKHKIAFRLLANNMLIQKERYPRTFQEIPFESFLGYVDSFRFDRCEVWQTVADLVKKYAVKSDGD